MANAEIAVVTELQKQNEQLKYQLEAVKKGSIASLGDGEVFFKRLPGGQIRSVKGAPILREANGEIAVIQGKAMTTSKGFNSLNQIAGLSIVTPEKLTLPNGDIVVNPYPIADPDSGTISKIWVKKMAIGYSPIGNLVVTTATLLYDIKMYFIQDVMKKVQYNKAAGRVCLEQTLTEEEKRNGIFLKIEGSLGIWASVSEKDILKAMDTFINKKLFAERNAQSICERLAMSKHPALAHAAYVKAEGQDKNQCARVHVVGFVTDFSREQILDIASKAEKGEEVVIDGKKAEIIEMAPVEASAEEIDVEADPEEHLSQVPHHDEQQPQKTLFDLGGRF